MFTFADTSGVGVLTHLEFIKLLNQLHPFDKKRTKRALAEMDWREDKNMTYAEFCHMNDILPNILYPAFRLQHQMRAKVLYTVYCISLNIVYFVLCTMCIII